MCIRVGILGCADIARRSLAPAFIANDHFRLVGIASRSKEKALEFMRGLGLVDNVQVCDYDKLISSDDIDLVYCPLPTGLHYEWVRRCLEAGKHVLCEKSLAVTYDEVFNLIQLARERRLLLMESFQFRFHAQNLYVKKLLAEGALGEVRQMVVKFGIPPFPEGAMNIRYSRELGGGALLDNGAYTIKATTFFLGGNVDVLAAMKGGETDGLGNVDLTGAIMMSANNIPVHTAYGFDHFYQNGYEIWGTKGRVSTSRAFTARMGFAAPVEIETLDGKTVRCFDDDHFDRMLDAVAEKIKDCQFESEYEECLTQARILNAVRKVLS